MNTKITAATKDFVVISQPSSALDSAKWRHEDSTLAPMFRPTIDLNARSNSTGSNVNCTLRVRVPVVQTVDSQQVAPNTVVASATITSLQNITGEDVEFAVDSLIAGLTSMKEAIVNGRTSN